MCTCHSTQKICCRSDSYHAGGNSHQIVLLGGHDFTKRHVAWFQIRFVTLSNKTATCRRLGASSRARPIHTPF